MSWPQIKKIYASDLLLKYRWPLVAILGLSSFVFEAAEHLHAGDTLIDPHFFREVLYFVFLIPILGGYILTILYRSEGEKSRLVQRLNLENDLIQEMGNAQTWEELTAIILRFPLKIASFSNIVFQLYNVNESEYETVSSWQDPDQLKVESPILFSANNAKIDKFNHQADEKSQELFETTIYVSTQGNQTCYSLPLINGSIPVAVLHLLLPDRKLLDADRQELLISIAPAIAFAIDNLQPHGAGIVRALATQEERKRLARYLHDSLGQNLGYLVLKLDQLKGDDVLEEVGAIRQELTQMRNVANQAYEQIRSTLMRLRQTRPDVIGDLDRAIRKEIEPFLDNSQITFVMTQNGIKQPVSNQIKNRILGIVREAVINVEKHAEAQKVSIDTNWSLNTVSVSIRDDGLGFDTESLSLNHRFGLMMMQERAQEINGRLICKSKPGQGTEIIVYVPLSNLKVAV